MKLPLPPIGTFVVIYETRVPDVQMIGPDALRLFGEREAIAGRYKAVRATFGSDALHALPANSQECMEIIGTRYVGIYQREVRGLCAAIALGKPFNQDPEGGDRVKQTPIKPKPIGPRSVKVNFRETEKKKHATHVPS